MIEQLLLRDAARGGWLRFARPLHVVEARSAEDVLPALREMEARVAADGLIAAGYVCYEAAAGFDAALATHSLPDGEPLLAFGLFRAPELVDPPSGARQAGTSDWSLDTSRAQHAADLQQIREQIAAGNTYQVNYTIRAMSDHVADPWQLFLQMLDDVPYAAYVDTCTRTFVSASPELFFDLDGERLVSRPMKGTAARGLASADDRARHAQLAHSAKDRAENVMIADMLRNDMGRVAAAGSVAAESLFAIEKYATVWQATSTISARTSRPVADIFAAMFPCASITGAPKVASMRLIAALERSPRGIYTGAIGYIAPGRRARFSVAIRTACVDRATRRAIYGVGGGIVWDSVAADEFDECLAKARILRRPRPATGFDLLETMLWTREDGYWLLERHLARLAASADYFDFRCDTQQVLAQLQRFASTLTGPRHRVRLTLDRYGTVALTQSALDGADDNGVVRLRLAAEPVDIDDVTLYHKTTARAVYENAMATAHDCDDVILWNTDREVTETTVANLIVREGRHWFTPPVSCGLLAGVGRGDLVARGALQERRIRIDDLLAADDLAVINSVRGRRPATLLRD